MSKPVLTALDQQRLSDAQVINGKTIYYARSEAEIDVWRLLEATNYSFSLDMWFNSMCPDANGIPTIFDGQIIRFQSDLSFSELLGYISLIPDGHILMRTLDVVPNARFYDVVCADDDEIRVKKPRNAKQIEERLLKDERSIDDFIFNPEKNKFVRIMNGGEFRKVAAIRGGGFDEKYEDVFPKEDVEPKTKRDPKYDDRPNKNGRASHKMRMYVNTHGVKYKTLERICKKTDYYLNGELDLDVHIHRYYDRDSANDPIEWKRFPHHWDVTGSPEQLELVVETFRKNLPKKCKGIDYFIAENDDNWEEKYREHLYATID